MHTNIDTPHALSVISTFLHMSPIPQMVEVDVDALLAALNIVMRHNVFRFGDTYWLQTCGTAMDAPPAPMYATLYFAIHELELVPLLPQLSFYGRSIDDVMGVGSPFAPCFQTHKLGKLSNTGQTPLTYGPGSFLLAHGLLSSWTYLVPVSLITG